MAKKGLANRRLKWTAWVVAIVFLTLIVSIATYYYQQARVDETKVVLEIVDFDRMRIVVRNTGDIIALNLESIPPAVFDPPSIAPGEESVGKFTLELIGFKKITVNSGNGGNVVKNIFEDF
ncbi:MAG: hypothetical protein V3R82_02340 [Candidatus Hydrothermarchaeales archaeon]